MPDMPERQDKVPSQITEIEVKKIEYEVAKWIKFVNLSGIISMGLAVSCIGTSYHQFTGAVSLLFMVIYYIYGWRNFPPTIKKFRNEKKLKRLNEDDENKLKAIEAKHFGFWKFMFSCLLYLLPILLLFSLAIGWFDDLAQKYECRTKITETKPSCIHPCYSSCKGKSKPR